MQHQYLNDGQFAITGTVTDAAGEAVALGSPGGESLEGMGLVNEWTDYENQSGELPQNVWGTSDADGADRIGMSVEFANGLQGTVTYSGVSGLWNSTFGGLNADTRDGLLYRCQRSSLSVQQRNHSARRVGIVLDAVFRQL